VLDSTPKRIDGFESPLGMELLATDDWLIEREHAEPTFRVFDRAFENGPQERHLPSGIVASLMTAC
jgi:hypothetical protein